MLQWRRVSQGMRGVFLAAHGLQYTPRSNSFVGRLRQYSTVTSSRSDDVNVKVGSGGHINLNIYRPRNHSSSTPTILFLPRGPLPPTAELKPESDSLSLLSLHSHSTIVCINYRLSSDGQHQFPQPIHDVLAGYDWVLKHLVHNASAHDGAWSTGGPRRVGVYGELIGGGLAAMLALTESHVGRSGIGVAAVANPVVDWTFPDTAINPQLEHDEAGYTDRDMIGKRKQRSKANVMDSWTAFGREGPISATDLLSLRKRIFPRPEYYFDPFASPLLFFRTPGIDVPPEDARTPDPDQSSPGLENEPATRRRKAHRRFPPSGSGLRLPKMRVIVKEEGLLRDQGVALVDLMRRSIVLHEQPSSDRFSGPWVYDEEQVARSNDRARHEAEQRVRLVMEPGRDLLPTGSPDDRAEGMMEVGRWFQNVLH